MTLARRGLQILALVGTLLIGVVAFAIIVSQTSWFKEWARRYIVRESRQYLNGELSIGRLSGNLFFGAELTDVAVDLGGERVIAVKDIGLDYSVLDLVSKGLVIDDIRINEPRIVLRRTSNGWNLGRLVKEERREAEREGPARPVAIGSIGISAGDFVVEGVGTTGAVDPPRRIEKVDAKLSFDYEPVHFTVDVDHLSFLTASPDFSLNQLSGTIAVRDDNVYFEDLKVRSAESDLRLEGVIEQYLERPIIKLTARSDKLSLPELGRIVPALRGVRLQPAFNVDVRGPLDRLVLDLDVRSSAGAVKGGVTVDAQAPTRGVKGSVAARGVDLSAIAANRALRSNINGTATFDLIIPAAGRDAVSGRFRFSGPYVKFAQYEAKNVRAAGRLAGPRVYLDDARGAAYGGRATARGVVVRSGEGRALAFDLRGTASNVDLSRLPPELRVPPLASDLTASSWHAEGRGRAIAAETTLGRSVVEGATFADGTTARVVVNGDRLEYASKGAVTHLDLQRMGRALDQPALAQDRFKSDVSGQFDVRGSGRTFATTTLDASGELADTHVFGGRLPRLGFDAHLDRGSLAAKAEGSFAGFDPAALFGRPDLKGEAAGTLNVDVRFEDVTGPMRPETISASGRVDLGPTTVGGFDVEKGVIDARLERGAGRINQLEISGPDLHVQASGPVTLTDAGQSDVAYHLETPSLDEIGRLVRQPLQGAVVLDGRLTGNRAALRTSGVLDGSNVRVGDNGALDVNSQYDVSVPDLQLAKSTIAATTNATFIKAAGLEIQEISAKTTYTDPKLTFDAAVKDRGRQLAASGHLILHPDHRELHVPSLTIRTEGIEWKMAGSDAAVQYSQSQIRLMNVRLVSGAQSLAVEGSIARVPVASGFSRTPPGPVGSGLSQTLQIKAANVDLAQIEKITLQDRGLHGLLSADARLTGTVGDPRVEGQMAIAKGAFRTFTFDSLAAKVDYTGTGVTVDARLQQNPTEWLTAKGFAPMTLFRAEPTRGAEHVAASTSDRVDLHIESSPIDLGVVQGFTSQVTNVRGTLQANVHVTGSGRDPHVSGAIEVHGGAFTVPAGGVAYSGLDTRFDLQPDRVVVRDFKLLDEHGNALSVAGQIAVHERAVGDVNVTAQAYNFEIIDNEFGDVDIDTNLKLTGELRRPRLEGSVKVEQGRIEVDRVLQEFASSAYATEAATLPRIEPGVRAAESSGGAEQATEGALEKSAAGSARAEREPARPAPPPPASPIDQLTLDLQLHMPDNLVLRGTDLRPSGRGGLALGNMNITVGGDLRVRKTPGDHVRLVGGVNTVRGFYEFQGRRFELQRAGRIRFIGLYPPDPVIDLTGVREIAGVEAQVHVRGTMRTPELTLSSRPPLDDADILSLIVFNQPINSLDSGQKVSLAQRAGAIASGFIASPLAQSIGKALDLDLFEIETTEEAGDLGANVTLGQQLSEHLFVRFRQQFGPQDASEFLLEYRLGRFLRLQSSVAPGGGNRANRTIRRRVERASADLIFFFSY